MTVYILGAGASVDAGYPLASQLLHRLSEWLDGCDASLHWVPWARNRIVQIRETLGTLDDFERLLGTLEAYGYERVHPTGPTTYFQDHKDIWHDCTQGRLTEAPARGFYPQYLRSDLISVFREMFYQIEEKRRNETAYDHFADGKIDSSSSVITFNYDVALERALAKAGKWDVGNGYGFTFLPDRPASPISVYKPHGSVNWFKHPLVDDPPPVIFKRDLKLLGYDFVDPRLGGNGSAVDNSGTFILPDPEKKFYWERFWGPLWESAGFALREASRVFIHGYSMPNSDVRARQLIFDNIAKSAAIAVYCRSMSDRIANEFRKHGFTSVRAFPHIDFEAWTVST